MEDITAELSGSVWKILVAVGDQVSAGQEIMILESMKMEIPVLARTSGAVEEIAIAEGVSVSAGDLLARIATSD